MAFTSNADIKEHLNDIFDRLCSPEAHISSDGQDKLQKFIDSSKKTPLTCDGNAGYTPISDWLEILETKISEFMSAKPYNPNKQKGSLRALDLLMENQIRLHHYTRHLGTITSIRPSTDLELQEHAASTLGKLHHASGNKYTQSVEYEIRVFFEFLNHYEDETQMLQAVLMLKQIAAAMPTLFIAKATSDHFFTRLLPAFRSNAGTRERGAGLLNVVTRLFASREVNEQRETDIRNTWAFNVYKCSKLLSENLSNESDCHGAILMLTELVSVANDKKIQSGTTLQDYNTGNFDPLRKVSLNTLPVDKFDSALDGGNMKQDLPKDVYSHFACRVILTNYDEICTQVLSIMLQSSSYKDTYTRHSLVCLISKLAAVDPNAFERHKVDAPISSAPGLRKIFHESITYLTENQPWKMPQDKRFPASVSIDPELQSLAMLAKIMGKRIEVHKDRLLTYIHQIFNPEPMSLKRGTRMPMMQLPSSAYALVAYLVQALNFTLEQNKMDTLLGDVMKSGLNRQLAICFHDICSAGAPDKLKLELRDKLIRELTLKIVEFEAKQSTDESMGVVQTQKSRKSSSFTQGTPPVLDAKDESSVVIIMALEILAAFDFTGISLSRTVNFCAQRLLVHDKAIRLAACKACCNLIISDDANFLLDSNRAKTARAEAEHTLKSVLPKIINLGVTDPSKSVREAIVSSLDSRFDRYLVQADNLNALFIGLYDEYFKVRQYVVCILGRLSEANAAYVLPALRKLLLQLLKEFEYTRNSIVRENCSILLGNLIYSTPRLLSPYLESLMKCIIPKFIASPNEPNVAIAIMRMIGILAEVSGREIGAYLAKLLPEILEFIKDTQNPKKRVVGLWTLSNLIFSSGRVVQPCIDYPELMDILLDLVKTEVSIPVRREVIKLLGSLGPLDPYTYKTILQPMLLQNLRQAEKEVENTDPNLAEMTSMIESSVMDEVYPAVATDALLKILSDPTQAQYWPRVVESFRFMIVSMGIKSVSFIWRVIPAYLNVLRHPSVSTDQNQMSEIILYNLSRIVNTVKEHIRPYLKDIVECLNDIWSTNCECDIIELLSYLAKFVGTDLKRYFHILIPRVVEILRSDHRVNNPAVYKLIQSFQSYGVMLEGFMYMILPPMMRCLESFQQPDIKRIICQTLVFLCEKNDMADFSSLMVHSLLRVVEVDQHVTRLSYNPGTSSSSSNLNQMVANGADKAITNQVFDVLAAICFTLKSRFHIFRPIVDQVAKKYNINHLNYQFVLDNIDHMFHSQTGKYRSDIGARIFKRRTLPNTAVTAESVGIERHSTEGDIAHLKRAWCTEGKISKEDWINWFKNLSSTLLSRSPSPILRGCSQLDHPQLRRDLFNVAFLSCWVELDQLNQNEFNQELEVALTVDNVPELTLAILNLAEFMEHSEKGPLPLDHLLLGKQALKSGAYAKALYYRESALMNHDPSSEEVPKILESLIQVNTKLQNYEAATGVLRLATKKKNFRVDESWYESLGQWENALQQYNLRVGPKFTPEYFVGKMRCLDGLAEWEDLNELVKEKWDQEGYKKEGMKETIAELALRACWALGNWEEMPTYVSALPEKSYKQNYYKAACALHDKDTYKAVKLIQECRDLVDNELTTLVKESYNRAYQTLVQVKHLSEMEEVITYNYLRNRQESIKQMWRDRLLGGQPNVQDWLLSIHVHSLALRPEENEATMLKFASLCMRQNKMKQSFKIIQSLLSEITLPDSQKLKDITDQQNLDHEVGDMTERLADACSSKISVVYMYLKQLWEVHHRHDAVKQSLIKSLGYISQKVSSMYSTNAYLGDHTGSPAMRRHDRVKQVARFCLLYASWQISYYGINTRSMGDIITHCQIATEHDKQWYKAWRMLAESSAEASKIVRNNPLHSSLNSSALSMSAGGNATFQNAGSLFGTQRSNSSGTGRNNGLSSSQSFIAGDQVKMHFLVAINAFVKSIRCCWDKNKDTLQDTLRLLTLLFENASLVDNAEMVLETLKQVHVDVWLQVIPQLIARVGSARTVIGKIILPLLIDVGKAHPHAAVYSLMVGAKSSSVSRSQAIQTVLDSMKDRYPDLIKQAQILSHELIRVSILWHELWHEGLEEASKQYFADRNPRGMFETLEPLHQLIEKGPETLKENSFMQHFGRDLMEAKECCNRYQQQGNSRELSQAWDLYYQVFRNITKQNQSMTSLELNYVSPKLLNCCRDLDLAVPGTYKPNKPIIRIQSVNPVVSVIQSKQKPRKLCISGNNGKDYQFLLKGHEDMRQDERVLQLFGLVNSLLANDKHNLKRNLGAIPRYAVIPLSTNSGLCGWVPHCDPLHTLIKEYRDKTKTQLNLEHRLMLRLANDYDHLTKMQKVEVFESALNATNGLDLAKIMWYRSANSEIWYERRLTYTRSLAVMSMVGYILGLGDRHPSNIMLERLTGNIIHIDFGDCFEVAVHREKFPEKIPFRLTRMLIKAMEVNGIEGNYRIACETTMRLLRQNRDSLLAVLEAFVNDPLLNWLVLDVRSSAQNAALAVPPHGINSGAHHTGGGYPPQRVNNGGTNSMMIQQNQAMPQNGGANSRSSIRLNPGPGGDDNIAGLQPEGNRKALDVLKRVNDKLNGEDFGAAKLDVQAQVSKLIDQATSHENLCQSYIGWCPFW